MLGQRGDRTETLAALVALDLHATIGVHSLVPAKIRKLRVSFEAHLTLKGLHRGVNVRMLFEAGRCSKGFATFSARVTSGSDVMASNVPLKIRWIGEYLQCNREKKIRY